MGLAAPRPALALTDLVNLGAPSGRSAVIVRAALPEGLERLRRRSLADANEGLPAHLTLLYPFVAPERLRPGVRRRLGQIAAGHDPFDYRLVAAAIWPDTTYVAVDPVEPFVRLQRELEAAFPGFPIYGHDPDFAFVPHVTIAEGTDIDAPAVLGHPGWQRLPLSRRAAAIELIAQPDDGPWRTIWRLPLGRMPA